MEKQNPYLVLLSFLSNYNGSLSELIVTIKLKNILKVRNARLDMTRTTWQVTDIEFVPLEKMKNLGFYRVFPYTFEDFSMLFFNSDN